MLLPLFRFHLRVGVRLALRAAAPLAGLPFIAILLQQDPLGATKGLAAWLLAPPGDTASGLGVAAVACVLAAWAAPRVTAGMAGWMAHLPATAAAQRRAALAALLTAQGPLVIACGVLAALAVHAGRGVPPSRPAALLLMCAAAALAMWPGVHARRSRPLAALAIVCAAPARGPWLAIALVLVILSERLAGSPATPSRRRRLRARAALPVPLLVGARALGLRLFLSPVVALAPLGAMAAYRINNDLTPGVAAGAARLGGGIAVAVLVASLVERLATRRPAWVWARSLPVGSRRRVREDAALLAIPCVVPLAVTAYMDPLAALAVAGCVPAVVCRGAGAVRRSVGSKTGPSTRLLAESALLACYTALVPWLAIVAFAACPLVWRTAAEQDRQQKVSRWEERHHSAAGDPLS